MTNQPDKKEPRVWTLHASRFRNGHWTGPRFYDEGIKELVVVEKSAYDAIKAQNEHLRETSMLSVVNQLRDVIGELEAESVELKNSHELMEQRKNREIEKLSRRIAAIEVHRAQAKNFHRLDIEKLEAENARLKGQLDTRGIHTCSDVCDRPMCVMGRENQRLRDAAHFLFEPSDNPMGHLSEGLKRLRRALNAKTEGEM